MNNRLLQPLVLILLTASLPGQQPRPHPLQEDRDLHNATVLPYPDNALQERLKALDTALTRRRWTEAARLLVDLGHRQGETLVRGDRRFGQGLLVHLAARVAAAPPALDGALREASRSEWEAVDPGTLVDAARLEALLHRNPFHSEAAAALLRLADLHLEAGRLDGCRSALHRLALVPDRRPTGERAAAVAARHRALRRAAALSPEPWPVPRGGAAGLPPAIAVKRKLAFTPLEWYLKGSAGARRLTLHRERHRERGVLLPRGRMVLCGGQVCLHTGTHLWRLDPERGVRLGSPTRLGSWPTADLPRTLAASGRRLVLVRGPRPKPGDDDVDHHLECLRLPPDGKAPGRPLWAHPGRMVGPLPAGLRGEDRKALTRGPLAFGRGPTWSGGDLLVTVFAPLDKTKVSAFLVRLDGLTGRVRWVRFLAQGAPEAMDPRLDRLSSVSFPRLTGAPLCLYRGVVHLATDLGTIHAVDGWDGRPLWAFRVARAYPEPGREHGFIRTGLVAEGGRLLAGLKDSDWVYLLRTLPAPGSTPLLAPPLPRRGLTQVVGLRGRHAYFTSSQDGEHALVRLELPTGLPYQAPPLQSGEFFCGPPILLGGAILFATVRRDDPTGLPDNGYLYRADLARDLYLELDWEPEGPVSLLGPLLPWGGGVIAAGYQGFALWRPAK